MVPKKITRKELLNEPDEFLTVSHRVLQFVAAHRRPAALAAGLLAAVVLVTAVVNVAARRSEAAASRNYHAAIKRYEMLLADRGAEAALEATEDDLLDLTRSHARRAAGRLAVIRLGNAYYRAGRYDRAIELYRRGLKSFDDHPVLRQIVWASLGHSLFAKGEEAAAADYFEKIAADDDALMRPEALFHLGEAYAQMGDRGKSQAAFETILDEHAGSIYADIVKERLRENG